MNYRIMSADLKGISLEGGQSVVDYYNRDRQYHLNPKTSIYGDVLVRTKRIKVGFSLKVKLFYRSHWYWTPSYKFNFKWGDVWFHWLFFMIWFEELYHNLTDKVVVDHLNGIDLLSDKSKEKIANT